MSKHLISCVEAAMFSVVKNVILLFEAEPTYSSYRVEWFSLINDFPWYAVLYWWSLVLKIPDMSSKFCPCSLWSVAQVGPMSIPSSLELPLVHSSISFGCIVIHPCDLGWIQYILLCSASSIQGAFINVQSHKITITWQFLTEYII